MKQLSRISKYVESLMPDTRLEDGQSVILTAQTDVIAGDNGNCENYITLACSGKNESCTNYGVCDRSKNEDTCLNKPNFNYNTDSCKS